MRVLFDHQIFTFQRFGGISRYFFHLIRELRTFDKLQVEIPLLFSNNEYISAETNIHRLCFLRKHNFRGKVRIMNLFNKMYSIFHIRRHSFDVFHPTYYDPYFLASIKKKPFVLTIHDMTHEKFPYLFKGSDKTALHKRVLAQRAAKIIAVSNTTKKDLLQILGVHEKKVEVIYHGIAAPDASLSKAQTDSGCRFPGTYILYVGLRTGYKNFKKFLIATSSILRKQREMFLLCAGGGPFNKSEIELMRSLEIEDKVKHYKVDDVSLFHFYRHALVFVFPSLYEGFGLPVLEAFASGCPVVCSNRGSLPEVASDAALYFDPESEDSIRQAVEQVLKDENLRKTLVRNGEARLKLFSWRQTAEKTKKLYESVI